MVFTTAVKLNNATIRELEQSCLWEINQNTHFTVPPTRIGVEQLLMPVQPWFSSFPCQIPLLVPWRNIFSSRATHPILRWTQLCYFLHRKEENIRQVFCCKPIEEYCKILELKCRCIPTDKYCYSLKWACCVK